MTDQPVTSDPCRTAQAWSCGRRGGSFYPTCASSTIAVSVHTYSRTHTQTHSHQVYLNVWIIKCEAILSRCSVQEWFSQTRSLWRPYHRLYFQLTELPGLKSFESFFMLLDVYFIKSDLFASHSQCGNNIPTKKKKDGNSPLYKLKVAKLLSKKGVVIIAFFF